MNKKKYYHQKLMKLNQQNGILKFQILKLKGREWLKSQVSRAFLPKYFPNYEKYLWIDCDAWVNDWKL
jgi:lipopolysaccharide biosynthesis glycosyltransferase